MSHSSLREHQSPATTTDAPTDLSARERQLATECGVIGVDQTGHEHRLRNRQGDITIYVTPAGSDTVVHKEELGDRPLAHWLDYVETRRGWLDCWAAEDTGLLAGAKRLAAARRYVETVEK